MAKDREHCNALVRLSSCGADLPRFSRSPERSRGEVEWASVAKTRFMLRPLLIPVQLPASIRTPNTSSALHGDADALRIARI